MGEIAVRQAILHGLIAAGFVEALLRAWRIRRAHTRLGFWMLALAFPFLVLPSFLLLASVRNADRFAAGRALLSSERWHAVRVGGIAVDDAVFGVLALAGVLLLLRDLVPFLVGLVRDWRETRTAHGVPQPALTALVSDLALRMSCVAPAITMLRTGAPVLFVRGLLHPVLVVSDGVVARLSPPELEAAIAHELAHARFRDPLAGWVLLAARLAMFWNPAVQLIARAIAQEMEHRADALAAGATGPQVVAGALRALSARNRAEAGSRMSIELLAERFYHEHIATRLAAVLAPAPAPPLTKIRFVATATALGVLLFFVV